VRDEVPVDVFRDKIVEVFVEKEVIIKVPVDKIIEKKVFRKRTGSPIVNSIATVPQSSPHGVIHGTAPYQTSQLPGATVQGEEFGSALGRASGMNTLSAHALSHSELTGENRLDAASNGVWGQGGVDANTNIQGAQGISVSPYGRSIDDAPAAYSTHAPGPGSASGIANLRGHSPSTAENAELAGFASTGQVGVSRIPRDTGTGENRSKGITSGASGKSPNTPSSVNTSGSTTNTPGSAGMSATKSKPAQHISGAGGGGGGRGASSPNRDSKATAGDSGVIAGGPPRMPAGWQTLSAEDPPERFEEKKKLVSKRNEKKANDARLQKQKLEEEVAGLMETIDSKRAHALKLQATGKFTLVEKPIEVLVYVRNTYFLASARTRTFSICY